MEIFLSKQCESLTGSLGRGFGYHIQRRSDHNGIIHFWGVRQSKGDIPPYGHWRFILSCANLALSKLYITDFRVSRGEIMAALWEAGIRNIKDYVAANPKDFPSVFRLDDVLNLKKMYNL